VPSSTIYEMVRQFLCGRLNKPHYGTCPSVCSYGLPTGKEKGACRKPQICININVPQIAVTGTSIFILRGHRTSKTFRKLYTSRGNTAWSILPTCTTLASVRVDFKLKFGRPHLMSAQCDDIFACSVRCCCASQGLQSFSVDIATVF